MIGIAKALLNGIDTIGQRYDCMCCGQARAAQGGFNNPYQYTGRELDESGFYFYRARYYHPGMARFISEDPIGLAGGPNFYAYAGENPVRFSNPLGLDFLGKCLAQNYSENMALLAGARL